MEKNKDEELDFLAQEMNKDNYKRKSSLNSSDDIFADSSHVYGDNRDEAEIGEKRRKEINPDYHYPDQKSLKRMNFGLWLSENRKNINTFFIIFLSALSLGFFSFSVVNLYSYIKSGDPRAEMTEENLIIKSNVQQLSFSQVKHLPGSEKDDLAILVKNDNANYYVVFDYCFNQGDNELSCGKNFILPSEEKYIVAFSVDSSLKKEDYSFNISKMSWTRISKSIVNYELYHKQRLGVAVKELSFNSPLKSHSSAYNANNLEFTLINETAFSYFELPLDILFFSGSELRGVNRHIVNNLYTGESRQINLNWSAPLAGSDRVEVRPSLNIFDENEFIKYKGN